MPRPRRGPDVPLQPRTRILLAWSLWLATFGCCAAGLAVTLAVTRPLTIAVLVEGAARALAYPLGYATIGLVYVDFDTLERKPKLSAQWFREATRQNAVV